MSRTLQHICWADAATNAAHEGEKVTTLCGKRVYQMPNMKVEIPTCTRCATALMAEHAKATRPAFRVSAQGSHTWAAGWVGSGGAA